MRALISTLFLLTTSSICFSQNRDKLDSLLQTFTGKSASISTSKNFILITMHGLDALPILATFFTDPTVSAVYSDCHGRNLTKGEVAIIVADHIETMPYFTLTGLQNCMMQACDNNPNFIEYYLEFIRFRGMTTLFQSRYIDWLKKNYHYQ